MAKAKAAPKSTKSVTVKEADAKAADIKNANDAKDAILVEAMKLFKKDEHSVQHMFAYCRQLEKYSK